MSSENSGGRGIGDLPESPEPLQAPELVPRTPGPRLALIAVLAVLLIGGGAAAAVILVNGGDSGPTTFDDASAYDTPSDDGSNGATDLNSSGGWDDDSSSDPTTTVDVTVTDAPPPPPPPNPGGPSVGEWIVQLESVSTGAGQAALDRQLAETRSVVPDVQVLDSSDFASLNPGYWVVYHPGPFTNGLDAVGFCDSYRLGMPDDCLGRLLTSSRADVETSQCWRAPNGELTDACSR